MSTFPAVVAALVALGEAMLDSDLWQVIDGPAGTETSVKQRVLTVGGDETVVTTEQTSMSLTEGWDERYIVPLLFSVSLPGATTLVGARQEAMDAYKAVRNALLVGDLTLGLSAQGVQLVKPSGEFRLQPYARAEGRAVSLRTGAEVIAEPT